jgi:hypothetical protein
MSPSMPGVTAPIFICSKYNHTLGIHIYPLLNSIFNELEKTNQLIENLHNLSATVYLR